MNVYIFESLMQFKKALVVGIILSENMLAGYPIEGEMDYHTITCTDNKVRLPMDWR